MKVEGSRPFPGVLLGFPCLTGQASSLVISGSGNAAEQILSMAGGSQPDGLMPDYFYPKRVSLSRWQPYQY